MRVDVRVRNAISDCLFNGDPNGRRIPQELLQAFDVIDEMMSRMNGSRVEPRDVPIFLALAMVTHQPSMSESAIEGRKAFWPNRNCHVVVQKAGPFGTVLVRCVETNEMVMCHGDPLQWIEDDEQSDDPLKDASIQKSAKSRREKASAVG